MAYREDPRQRDLRYRDNRADAATNRWVRSRGHGRLPVVDSEYGSIEIATPEEDLIDASDRSQLNGDLLSTEGAYYADTFDSGDDDSLFPVELYLLRRQLADQRAANLIEGCKALRRAVEAHYTGQVDEAIKLAKEILTHWRGADICAVAVAIAIDNMIRAGVPTRQREAVVCEAMRCKSAGTLYARLREGRSRLTTLIAELRGRKVETSGRATLRFKVALTSGERSDVARLLERFAVAGEIEVIDKADAALKLKPLPLSFDTALEVAGRNDAKSRRLLALLGKTERVQQIANWIGEAVDIAIGGDVDQRKAARERLSLREHSAMAKVFAAQHGSTRPTTRRRRVNKTVSSGALSVVAQFAHLDSDDQTYVRQALGLVDNPASISAYKGLS